MGKRMLQNIESVFEEAKILEKVFEYSSYPKIIMNEKLDIYAANKVARDKFKIDELTVRKKRNLKKYLNKKAIVAINVIQNQVNQKSEDEVFSTDLQIEIDSSTYFFDVSVHPFISAKWHFWIFNDVTAKVYEQESRNQFIAIAGHEIKTPLAVVVAYTELLKRKYKDDKTALKYISKIENKSEVLLKFIDSIIDEIKIGAGKLPYEDKVVSIDTSIKSSIEEIRKANPKRNIVYNNKSKGAEVLIDPERIGQVLQNLIMNAINHSSNKKEIIVTTAKKDKCIIVSVKDFGTGIKIKDQKRIFRAFYRSDSRSKKTPGLGLGLYISSQILKRYGSKLQLNSRSNKGSTFYFELPIHTAKL